MTEKLAQGTLYPVVDRVRGEQLHKLRARWTGEKRAPKAGEWYLSGAIIEAYRAPNDLTTAYHIAEIVRIEEGAYPHFVTGIVPVV